MATHFAGEGRRPSVSLPQVDDGVSTSAPSPLPLTAEQTGSFQTLSTGQGAVTANRENAAGVAEASRSRRTRRPASSRQLSRAARKNAPHRDAGLRTNRRLFVGIGVAAALVVALASFIGCQAVRSLMAGVPAVEPSSREERVEVDLTQPGAGGIEYDGYVYATMESGGRYSFVRTTDGASDPLQLFELQGEPVSVVLYDGAFVIAENTSQGWDVVAYGIGDGSLASALVGQDGNPVAGEGRVVSAALDGDALVLQLEDGTIVSTPLR